jgi:hypothetical protein
MGEIRRPPGIPTKPFPPAHEIGLKRIPATVTGNGGGHANFYPQFDLPRIYQKLTVRHAEAPFRPLIKVQTGPGETSMPRNFGLRRQTHSGYRRSSWGPLVALTLIMVGLIDVAAHLHQR